MTPRLSWVNAIRVDEDPRIGFLHADVARFCDGLSDDLAPAQRLRLVAQLRTALSEVTDAALIAAMAAAASEGWGLRQIARAAGMSHEQVRRQIGPSESA